MGEKKEREGAAAAASRALQQCGQLQKLIDISIGSLRGLRTKCAVSNDLTQQEIRTLEVRAGGPSCIPRGGGRGAPLQSHRSPRLPPHLGGILEPGRLPLPPSPLSRGRWRGPWSCPVPWAGFGGEGHWEGARRCACRSRGAGRAEREHPLPPLPPLHPVSKERGGGACPSTEPGRDSYPCRPGVGGWGAEGLGRGRPSVCAGPAGFCRVLPPGTRVFPSSPPARSRFRKVRANTAFSRLSRRVLSLHAATAPRCTQRGDQRLPLLPPSAGSVFREDFAGEGCLEGEEDDTFEGVSAGDSPESEEMRTSRSIVVGESEAVTAMEAD